MYNNKVLRVLKEQSIHYTIQLGKIKPEISLLLFWKKSYNIRIYFPPPL